MAPFLPSDAFAIRDEIDVKRSSGVLIVDNMFEDYTRVRNLFLNSPAPPWKMPEGTRNFKDYYDCRQHWRFNPTIEFKFMECLSRIINIAWNKETHGQDNGIRTNWFLQVAPRQSDYAEIHIDGEGYTALTYLNTEEECSGGTAFFPEITEYEGVNAVNYWSSQKRTGKAVHIEMKPGRTVIHPSGMCHGAWHPDDSFTQKPRLLMVTRLVTRQ